MGKIKLENITNIFISLSDDSKLYFQPLIHSLVLKNGRSIYATFGTKNYLNKNNVPGVVGVSKFSQKNDIKFADCVRMEDLIKKRLVNLIINVPSEKSFNLTLKDKSILDEISDGETMRQLVKRYRIKLITEKEKAFDIICRLIN
ncbi:MAG: hypothetical protein ACOZAJ_04485 [Patescibacteria group bacterium]